MAQQWDFDNYFNTNQNNNEDMRNVKLRTLIGKSLYIVHFSEGETVGQIRDRINMPDTCYFVLW